MQYWVPNVHSVFCFLFSVKSCQLRLGNAGPCLVFNLMDACQVLGLKISPVVTDQQPCPTDGESEYGE